MTTVGLTSPGVPPFHARRRFDALLASARFQRWAARFPLTRPVARRRARALFDLCAGFVYSQVLLACVRLQVFEMLRDGPQTAEALATRLRLPPDRASTLLHAAAGLRLLARRRHGRFGLGALGVALCESPAIIKMIEHHSLLYGDLTDPVALLRGEATTTLGQYWPYALAAAPSALPDDQVAPYSALMAQSQALVAAEVLDAYPLRRRRCLLDVGGGEGTFLEAAAERAPALRLMLFDLPAVAMRARARLGACGLASRSETLGGDFLRDSLPRGADIVSLVRIVHDHDDSSAVRLLRTVRAALPAGGTLLLAEPMAGTRGAEPLAAYFGFYLLAMGRGRPRSAAELRALLTCAGFEAIRERPTHTPLLVRVLVARASDCVDPT